jgi:hypothetical protein
MLGPFFAALFAIFWHFALCASEIELPSPAQDSLEDDTVRIRGERRELTRDQRAGDSLTINPQRESRMDSQKILQDLESIKVLKTGSQTAQGYGVPTIRGHNSKMTQIYIDDILISDPHTGLPLLGEIDIRPFHDLKVYRGFASPEFASLNPVGTIQYRLGSRFARNELGMSLGRPYGASLFWLGGYQREKPLSVGKSEQLTATEIEGLIYARHHQTTGRYEYYDDNGTPYNKDDDLLAVRSHNGKRSYQLLPYLVYEDLPYRVRFFSIFNGSTIEIPSANRRLLGSAVESAGSNLSALEVRRDLSGSHGMIPDILKASVSSQRDAREFADPHLAVLTNESQKGLGESLRFQSDLQWLNRSSEIYLIPAIVHYNGRNNGAQAKQIYSRLYIGALKSFELIDQWFLNWEFKSGYDQALTNVDGERGQNSARGISVAFEVATRVFRMYGQLGLNERIPSILELYGDGGLFLANTDLQSERMIHKEIGTVYRLRAWQAGLIAYEDTLTNNIQILPAVGRTQKAQNIPSSVIFGVGAYGELKSLWGFLNQKISITHLDAFERVSGGRGNRLPKSPEVSALSFSELDFNSASMNLSVRYQSQTHSDLAQSIIIPAYTIVDLGADLRLKTQHTEIAFAISVDNLFDVKRLPIKSGHQRGYTAYGDFEGEPLPGRTYRVSANWIY